MRVIAINDIGNELEGPSLKVNADSLKLNKLAQLLDGVSGEQRVMPKFEAFRWDSWEVNPTKVPVGKLANQVIQNIQNHLG